MKNTINTKKYFVAAIVAIFAIVFSAITPVLAADVYTYSDGYSDDAYTYSDGYSDSYTYSDGYNDSYTYSDGYNDNVVYDPYVPEYDVTYTPYDSGYDVNYTPYYSTPSYVPRYYYNGNSTVTSGGFSGGTLTVVPPTTYTTNPYVTSGGFTGGTLNNYVDPVLTASCYVSANNSQTVTWSVSNTGGNGFYTYSWSGDENLVGSTQSVTKVYSFAGIKNANVTITSNGQSVTRTCSVSVNPQNQVLAFTDTNPDLQSVYLSDVPYTGAGDVARVTLFILALVLWSALMAYVFLKRKYNLDLQTVLASVVKFEIPNTDTKIQNALSNQVTSDTSEISFIEEYARMKKVILSTDASIKLVKLQRLGTASAIAIIDKLATSEWTAVGENDLVKFA